MGRIMVRVDQEPSDDGKPESILDPRRGPSLTEPSLEQVPSGRSFAVRSCPKLGTATLIDAACALIAALALVEGAARLAQAPETKAPNAADPEVLVNPAAGDAQSIAVGEKLYSSSCRECHGRSGKGNGVSGEGLDPPPANLVDGQWKHGATDGAMFVVIRDGVRRTGMQGFGKKLNTRQIWDVVNYVRSIGPKTSSPQ